MAELAEVKKKQENILVDLGLSYKLTPADREQFKHDKLISAFLIRQAANIKWREAMPRSDSRVWALIQDELFAEPGKLSLAKTEFDWLFDLINGCDYPASLSSWRWTLLNYLEELKRKNV